MIEQLSAELGQVTRIIRELGKLTADVGPDEDFYEAGFSSINSLELLLELETRFDVALPDDRFIEARTPQAIAAMIDDLRVGSV